MPCLINQSIKVQLTPIEISEDLFLLHCQETGCNPFILKTNIQSSNFAYFFIKTYVVGTH